jgi:Tfp pilus assembly protein PilF
VLLKIDQLAVLARCDSPPAGWLADIEDMKRACLLGLGLVLAGGCTSSNNPSTSQVPPPEASIADAPMPAIKPETYIAAGDLAASKGQLPRAAQQYELALKANPNDSETTKKLALIYVKGNQMPAALETWKRYMTVAKQSDDAYGSLGYAYELAGKPAEAEATYKAGIAAHPDGKLTHINYGLMLVRRNKVDEAVKQLGAVLEPPEVNYNIASVYSQVGRPDLAQFYYKRALECDPGFEPARQKLSMIN